MSNVILKRRVLVEANTRIIINWLLVHLQILKQVGKSSEISLE